MKVAMLVPNLLAIWLLLKAVGKYVYWYCQSVHLGWGDLLDLWTAATGIVPAAVLYQLGWLADYVLALNGWVDLEFGATLCITYFQFWLAWVGFLWAKRWVPTLSGN